MTALRIERRDRGRKAVLVITTARRARLYVRERGRRSRRLRGRRCGEVRVTLSRRHGRLAVVASVRQGTQRRTVVY